MLTVIEKTPDMEEPPVKKNQEEPEEPQAPEEPKEELDTYKVAINRWK